MGTSRPEGASTRANRRLAKAFKLNPLVVAFMLGAAQPPERLPDTYALGSPEEAAYYLLDGVEAWVSTPGAGEWLVEQLTTLLMANQSRRGRE